ncbi:MAG: RRXRR domain-containing protein [Xenococcaceae cyanobacterium MO_167.B27]|nr:RRXRR domain-containing protein [Xenococcaceae cyanobacterium MO_167.B27]
MFTFVLSKDKKPLSPCHPARARKLLSKGRASVYKRYPQEKTWTK